ncbi:hydroxypyruvate isomerase family protein [Cytobacillus firmus]|uniref:Hydroxypyruvate isomerase n=1 Tax=Cytobacillus firmus TaxID=1399 RepID=A0A380XSG9_CYTFI|nr:TIM barrel protein [Cytobacillus firmus]KAF0823163.1 Hydroxypyruvate isomerase [Cytobacillus firmus]MBG9542417.1 hydroxypyruvate isomerase [Cytobacillus firmus]MBG9552033.1 hydroxypyruvate isomerase [Cytobacillus firmus]MBG9558336.1 hydroxypyruvate isomerase [Cytobacillus firmus]MBG9573433.1 hydroxypyruvate isomerase [Cytobacillus firmus]
MNRFSVNLSTVFTEVPFLDRFKKAREAGFDLVECQFPYANTIEEIRNELRRNDLSMILINLPPGKWEEGDRGLAADPNRIEEFRNSVEIGIRYAKGLEVKQIHCMAGVYHSKNQNVFNENLFFAGNAMSEQGINLLIEPINPFDIPGYFLKDIQQAEEIINSVGLPNLKLQFDFYHIERIHGQALSFFQKYAELVSHVQLADCPGRHEPGTGEMDYKEILLYLQKYYKGNIGLEYNPQGRSAESFAWLKEVTS